MAQYLGAIDTRRLHLAEISDSRPDRLTLVYDQSNGYTLEQKEKGLKEKLNWLQHKQVPGMAYMAQASFLFVSMDPELLKEASERVRKESRFPYWRFIFPTVTGN